MSDITFNLESEMAQPVRDWLQRAGLTVKHEFALPWGICDLVGVSLNLTNVRKRLCLKQTNAIGPPGRIDLLSRIPDQETGRTISLRQLQRTYGHSVPDFHVTNEVEKLIADRFVLQTRTGCLQRLNGWVPLQKRIVSVELKLTRISEALCQAASNRAFATESFVAMPWDMAHRLAKGPRVSDFREAGVGIVAVDRTKCRLTLSPTANGVATDSTLQMHCVERFWRSRGNSA